MSSQPQPRPVYIAALPREIAGLVRERGWRAEPKLLQRNIHIFEHAQAIIACAGMGADRARLAVEAALALGPATQLVSVGWAGACIHRLRVGQVITPDIVVDSKTGERFVTDREHDREREVTDGPEVLVTVPSPANVVEKERLAVGYYASAVDMEAAAVARLARAHELPFHAIKAISDDARFELPDLSSFTTPGGQLREAAFGFHVALHPSLWRPVIAMAKSSKLAAGNLQDAIRTHISQHRNRTV